MSRERRHTVWASTRRRTISTRICARIARREPARVATPGRGWRIRPKCGVTEDIAVLPQQAAETFDERDRGPARAFRRAVHERDQYWTVEIAAMITRASSRERASVSRPGRIRIRTSTCRQWSASAIRAVHLPSLPWRPWSHTPTKRRCLPCAVGHPQATCHRTLRIGWPASQRSREVRRRNGPAEKCL